MSPTAPSPTPWTYAGVALVTLATLTFEILLTRIFSVTMWYHSAFVAISLAMFGMTAGAVWVYLHPGRYTPQRAKADMAGAALAFAAAVVASFLTHAAIPFGLDPSLVGLWGNALTYVAVAVPFVCSGLCVCLALTRFPAHASRLYTADLVGAAIGCVAVVAALAVTDGPTAVLGVAAVAALGALFLAVDAGERGRVRRAAAACAILAACTVGHTILVQEQRPILRLRWSKVGEETTPLYEKWNAHARIRIDGHPDRSMKPAGWGLSPALPADARARQLLLTIDSSAATVLTGFDGRLERLDYLRYDVTNLAYHLRHDGRVLVVGAGGGRDVLSALAFREESVVAVEVNRDVVDAVNGRFGDFTGHLDRWPGVSFVADEARSWLARSNDRFDLIQISLIDTWAATAAGAFVFAENALYTVECWNLLLSRLAPGGVLSVSRWYFRDTPAEMYRLTSLAVAALESRGVAEPRRHLLLVRQMTPAEDGSAPDGVGTLLISPQPLSDADVATATSVATTMGFDLMLTPEAAADSTVERIASGYNLPALWAAFPYDISPPTDDRPFFFHMLRLRDVFRRELWGQGVQSFNVKAVVVLAALLVVVLGLTYLGIAIPLRRTADRGALEGSTPLLVFFGAIGLGFMLVEVSQVQRLVIFLGHPAYGLSVVLFALLLSSGVGSLTTGGVAVHGTARPAFRRLVALVALLAAFALATPSLVAWLRGASNSVRMLASVALLVPPGLFMGMAFPLGLKLAQRRSPSLSSWLWGVNGATSVCASVLAVAIAVSAGLAATLWTGVACYAVAAAAFHRATRG